MRIEGRLGLIRQQNWYSPKSFGGATDNGPVLLLSEGQLMSQAKRFIDNFPGKVSYAVKANSDKRVIEILHAAGIHCFDVASLVEMATVRAAAPCAILHYHNPVRSRQEITVALNEFRCKRFAVDHMDELAKLDTMVSNRRYIEIAVRFATDSHVHSVQDFSSKFGATGPASIELLKTAKALGYRTGLTFHPGSQTLNPQPYETHIKKAAKLAQLSGCKIEFLNVGGGFPSIYAGSNNSELEHFFNIIGSTADNAFNGNPPKLECEPGRAMVAPAATLQTKIKAVRRNRTELFLNDGIYGGLMEASQFPLIFPHHDMPNRNPDWREGTLIDWKVFGPTCDPVDVLPRTLALPADIDDGEQIAFSGMGAYSTATATRFNGYGEIQLSITP